MNDALLAGAVFGFVLGVLHATALWRAPLRFPGATPATRLRYVAWTIALWTLFGSYVLWLWAPACVAYAWVVWRRRA